MQQQPCVLVVEDDRALREAICDTLEYGGIRAISAEHGEQALALLAHSSVDLIISDVQMDVMDGPTLLGKAKSKYPEIPFVLVTAYGTVEQAVAAMHAGAADYLLKPFEAEVLLEMVLRLAPVKTIEDSQGMVIADRQTLKLSELARRVAGSDATVLISGESGTGKEVLARYIHNHSPRSEQPFVAINCAAIPETMLESMLFGYEKGAYTGAHQTRPGKFEQANGGTLLLDEISEMDLTLQAKLLRVLQEKEVERLGGNKLIPLDVRVLATTNRQLRDEVAAGRFREDLYYRLNVFPLLVPPLRERTGDIVPLAQRLLDNCHKGASPALSPQAIDKLLAHCWKGNVRELANVMQRAAILTTGAVIGAADIFFEDELVVQAEGHSEPEAARETLDGMLDSDLKAHENQLIVDALKAVNGSRKEAAEKLGISPRTLRYKLARMKDQGVLPAAVA